MRGINRLLLLTIGALCMHQLYGKISIPIARQSCKYSIDIPDGWDTIPQNVFLQKLGKFPLNIGLTRSEERRVGKECRSRWSPYH